jgi:hypothetical protein
VLLKVSSAEFPVVTLVPVTIFHSVAAIMSCCYPILLLLLPAHTILSSMSKLLVRQPITSPSSSPSSKSPIPNSEAKYSADFLDAQFNLSRKNLKYSSDSGLVGHRPLYDNWF